MFSSTMKPEMKRFVTYVALFIASLIAVLQCISQNKVLSFSVAHNKLRSAVDYFRRLDAMESHSHLGDLSEVDGLKNEDVIMVVTSTSKGNFDFIKGRYVS
jgi:regulator of PEP synthase PpsR (kinase-PPPase family)